MPMLNIHVDDRSMAALERCAASLGRPVEDLAGAAVSEAAIQNDPQAEPPRLPPLPVSPKPRTPEDGMPVHTR